MSDNSPKDFPYLLISTANGKQKLSLVGGMSWTIGRSDRNSFVITDQWISRNHAMIKKNEVGEYYLIDLGTRNGSFVNEKRVSIPVILFHGDEIRLGQTHLEFYDPLNANNSRENPQIRPETLTETEHLRRLISVLVADLRDFKELSRQIDGNLLAIVVGNWFKESERILHRLGTIIDQFSGDSVMGIWLHQQEVTEEEMLHIFQAVRELQMMTTRLSREHSLPFPLRMGVGINTGYGLVGNVGSTEQPQYAAIGDAVNAAYRLEAASKQLNLDLAVGEQTYLAIAKLEGLQQYFAPYAVKINPGESPILTYGSKFEALEYITIDDRAAVFVKKIADKILTQILATGATKLLHFQLESPNHSALESARYDLEQRPQDLTPEINARLKFLLALDTEDNEQKRFYFEESLKVWQSLKNLDYQGCILYCLGAFWYNQAWQQANKKEALNQAKECLKLALEDFEQAGELDHVAKFIDGLGEILQQLEEWSELETLAQKALSLYQTHSEPLLLAQAYGFLAEVALSKTDFNQVQQLSSNAIALVGTPPSKHSDLAWKSSWFLCLLGLAKKGLNQPEEARKTLETAKAALNPYDAPPLYLRILDNLHHFYFEKGEYLTAFRIKQTEYSLEYQLGLRAFLGIGNIPENSQVKIPALQFILEHRNIALGRQEEVYSLQHKLQDNQSQIMILYGKTGVGKTCYLQMGLIPYLGKKLRDQDQSFRSNYSTASSESLKLLILDLDNYDNWLNNFQKKLNQNLDNSQIYPLNYPEDQGEKIQRQIIIDHLRQSNESYQLILLVFDQFETFFDLKRDQEEQQQFGIFIKQCLEISNLKIIISLPEDYLHHLLALIRLTNLDNIFNQNNLYYLQEFSIIKSQTIIQNLSKYSELTLDPDLIVQFTQDLARDRDTISPLELQLLGSQLERQNITTLAEYKKQHGWFGLLQKLSTNILANCGLENQEFAHLILELFKTDSENLLIKSRRQLESELNRLNYSYTSEKLDLVLTILIDSHILVKVPNGYQLFNQSFAEIITHETLNKILNKSPDQEPQTETTESKNLLKKIAEKLKEYQKLPLQEHPSSARIITRPRSDLYHPKIGNSLGGYPAGITAVSFSPNGKFLATASLDHSLKIWNLTDQKSKTLKEHQAAILSLSFDPNNLLIATASQDKTVKLWNLEGQNILTLSGHQAAVTSVCFNFDGQLIVTASQDKTAKIWTLKGENLITLTGHQAAINSVCFNFDGQLIATASQDKTVKIWTLKGENIITLTGHQAPVNTVYFSHEKEEEIIVTGSLDKTIKFWNFQGENLKTLTGHQAGITKVVGNADGSLLGSASLDTTVKIWNREGQLLQTLRGHQSRISDLSFSPNNQFIVTASWDKTLKFWSKQRETLQNFSCHEDWVNSVSFSPDSKILATASSDKTLKLWDLAGNALKTFLGHQDWVTRVCWSPDGKMIATTSWDKTVKIWDLEGNIILTLNHEDTVNSINFSPDGQILVSASMDKTVKLWNLQGQEILQLPLQDAAVMSATFSPDGQILATGSMDKNAKLWDLNGQELVQLIGHNAAVVEVIFSADGQTIATASWDQTVKLWSLDGQEKLTLEHQETVNSVSFSPDGQTIATASLDHLVKLWNLEGKSLDSFQCEEVVNSVSFSPDGQILAYGDRQGRVILQSLNILV